MAVSYEIPLSPEPQEFAVTLAGAERILRLAYADAPEGGWLLDIKTSAGDPIICGIPLVTGTDLLAQYAYLGIGGQLHVATDGDAGAVPTFDDLGITSRLFFVAS
jgi:hypothetical protein